MMGDSKSGLFTAEFPQASEYWVYRLIRSSFCFMNPKGPKDLLDFRVQMPFMLQY